ncbi:MAG: hypothetical protein MJZ83_03340 [Bacteroidaceae bacterium]|nr:hypothetical protein [Bacteroidaceae bacterium]
MKRHLILAAAALLCLTAFAQNSKKMNGEDIDKKFPQIDAWLNTTAA